MRNELLTVLMMTILISILLLQPLHYYYCYTAAILGIAMIDVVITILTRNDKPGLGVVTEEVGLVGRPVIECLRWRM